MTREEEVLLKEQMKKLAIANMIGFQTVLVFGIGMRLGIFDYLYN